MTLRGEGFPELSTKGLSVCIFVVGLQCAGKSAFLEIARDCGFAVAEWSAMVRQDLQADQNDRSLFFDNVSQRVASKGVEYYPNLIYNHLRQSGRNEHVVSGARNPNELKYFRSLYLWPKVIWISANYLARFQRVTMRSREDQRSDLQLFLKDDFHELAGGLAEIAAEQVDDILFNDSNYSDYERNVMDYLKINFKKGISNERF